MPFKTEKREANNADIIPNTTPTILSIFVFNIINTPQITKKPKIISTALTFLLKNIGSIKEAKKAPVENIARVIEILDCSIASKKVIQ
ncbi:MAG: Uncharacterised protein [Flavobacteriaceae bacterium]|nr:MAG: Uncharacterised protein [Flavobacteriaceae bacterium]